MAIIRIEVEQAKIDLVLSKIKKNLIDDNVKIFIETNSFENEDDYIDSWHHYKEQYNKKLDSLTWEEYIDKINNAE